MCLWRFFADVLDHSEWRSGFRRGTLRCLFTALSPLPFSGICTGIFNGVISAAGYVPPFEATSATLSDTMASVAANGYDAAFRGCDSLGCRKSRREPRIYDRHRSKNAATSSAITFFFVGLEVITGIALAFMPLGIER